ncbi:MAG TPA: hypothetical protein DD491_04080, partial [Halieaceae bacterium]|nr:hypothetical protein [Halieaceae bacterium]
MQLLMQPLMYTARILVACLLLLQLGTAPAHAAVKALVGGTVVDVDSGETLRDAVVVVDGERIAAIGASGEGDVP